MLPKKTKLSRISAGIEAARHQTDFRFVQFVARAQEIQALHLTDEYKAIRSNKDKAEYIKDAIIEKNFIKLIFDSFGITSKINWLTDSKYQAAVATSIVNENASLLDKLRRQWLESDDYRQLFKENSKSLKKNIGYIDRKNAKISGIFSKLTQEFYIDISWFDPDNATAEEFVGVLFHEIGHVFTYYETLVSETHKNELMHAFRQISDDEEKEKVAMLLIPSGKHDQEQIDKILDSDSTLESLVLSAGHTQVVNEIGNDIYAERGWEQLADDFAIKLGAGSSITTALDKVYKQYGHEDRESTAVYLMRQACMVTVGALGVIGSATTVAVNPALAMYVMIFFVGRVMMGDTTTNHEVYDNIEKRFKRMRQELVGRLKSDIPFSREEKKQLLKEIDIIDETVKHYHTRRTFFDLVVTLGGLTNRRLRNSMKEMALLEELANNDLHLLKAKLDTL